MLSPELDPKVSVTNTSRKHNTRTTFELSNFYTSRFEAACDLYTFEFLHVLDDLCLREQLKDTKCGTYLNCSPASSDISS